MRGTSNGIAGNLPREGRAQARPFRLEVVLALLLFGVWPAPAADLSVSVARQDDVYEVRGRFTTSASLDTAWRVLTDYEGIHAHILMMADQLSAGIFAQFPSRFR